MESLFNSHPLYLFFARVLNIDHQASFEKANQVSSKNKTTMAGFGISCLSKREIETKYNEQQHHPFRQAVYQVIAFRRIIAMHE
jgi:hypothetical protein